MNSYAKAWARAWARAWAKAWKLVIALSAVLAASAAAQTITLKAGHSAAVEEPYHLGLVDFAKRVKDATGGRVAIEIFADGRLGNEREMIERLPLGAIDLAISANAVLATLVPDLAVLDLPFLFDNPTHFEKAIESRVFDMIGDALLTRGYRLLGLYAAGARHIMTTKRAITSPSDLTGLTLRTTQNPVYLATFHAISVNPTPLAFGELYRALQSGLVDGAEADVSVYAAYKLYEVAPNWSMLSWTVMISPLIMAEARFKSLPAEVQTALVRAGRESAARGRAEQARSERARLEALKKAGVKIQTPDPAPFRKATLRIYDQFTKTDLQKAMVKAIQDSR